MIAEGLYRGQTGKAKRNKKAFCICRGPAVSRLSFGIIKRLFVYKAFGVVGYFV